MSLLFARVGEVVCYNCGQPVRRESPEAAADALDELPTGTRLMVGFEATVPDDEPVERWIAQLVELGYVRAIVDEPSPSPSLEARGNLETATIEPGLAQRLMPGQSIAIVLDRLTAGDSTTDRLRESLESAFAAGDGAAVVFVEQAPRFSASQSTSALIDGREWQRMSFSAALRCERCGIDYPEPEPQLFNFNRPLGACPECEGFGNIVSTDMEPRRPRPEQVDPRWRHCAVELAFLCARA